MTSEARRACDDAAVDNGMELEGIVREREFFGNSAGPGGDAMLIKTDH